MALSELTERITLAVFIVGLAYVMVPAMGRSYCHHEIFFPVIFFISVYVVDYFKWFKIPADFFLYYKAMFENVSMIIKGMVRNKNRNVAVILNSSTRPVSVISSLVESGQLVPAFYRTYGPFMVRQLAWLSLKLFAAYITFSCIHISRIQQQRRFVNGFCY